MSEDERAADVERLKTAAMALGEYFDSVQILATRHEQGTEHGTVNVNWGVGNWYSRYGQMREWITKAEEDMKIAVRPTEGED